MKSPLHLIFSFLFLIFSIGLNGQAISTWNEIMMRQATGGSDGNVFGWTVDVSGNYAIAGSYKAGAYILSRDQGGTDNWGIVKKLSPSTSGGDFGFSVAISGDYAVVGAIRDGAEDYGAVFLFSRNTGGTNQWGQVKKITGDGTINGRFGNAVALDGNYLAVGAYLDSKISAPVIAQAGAAYVFDRNYPSTNSWGLVQKITPSNRVAFAFFGSSVDVSNGIVLVGEPENDHDASGGGTPVSECGAAYVYFTHYPSPGSVTEIRKIVAPTRTTNEHFGESVSIDGSYAVTGTIAAGKAYVSYRSQGGTDQYGNVATLTPSGESGGSFGRSVHIDDKLVIIGAPGNSTDADLGNSLSGAGAAYIFKRGTSSSSWTQQEKLVARDRATKYYYGTSVSMTQNYAIAGAVGVYNDLVNNTQGKVYLNKFVTQASNLSISNVKSDRFTASWSNGNGTSRIVFMKSGAGSPVAPVDKTTYSANSSFGAGTQILSSGWYCVYNGTGTSITVTGMSPATNHQVAVYEYFGSAGTQYYIPVNGSSNLVSQSTGISLSGTGVNVGGGLITGTTSSMEYSLNSTNGSDGTWDLCTASNTSVSFTTGDVYIREKDIVSNFSLIATIAVAPSAPSYTISYDAETTLEQIPTTVEYNTDNDFGTTNTDGTNAAVGLTPGMDLFFRVKATDSALPGSVQQLEVPARPALASITINYSAETTQEGIASNVAYSTQSDMTASVPGTGQPVAITPGTDMYFRMEAGASSFKSGIFQLIVDARPAVATSYTINYLDAATNESILEVHEYSTSASMTDLVSGAGIPLPLIPGTDFYFRASATVSAFASGVQQLVVPAAPDKPAMTVNFENETSTENVSTEIAWSPNPDMSDSIFGQNLVIPVTPGEDLYFMETATASTFASEIQHLVVPQRPDPPLVSISDRNSASAAFMKSGEGTGDPVGIADKYEASLDAGVTWEQISDITQVDARGIKIILARSMPTVNSFGSLPTANLDFLVPEATLLTGKTCNGLSDFLLASSNTDNGKLYIIHSNHEVSNAASLDAAVASGKGAVSTVSQANTGIDILSTGIGAGIYYAWAMDAMAKLSARSEDSIAVHAIPIVDIGDDQLKCEGIEAVFDAGSGFSSYSWLPGGAETQTLNATIKGDYMVMVTDGNNCVNSDTVRLDYSLPYAGEELCLITIDMNTGKNLIVWERTADKGILSYNVYRQTTTLGVYDLIASLLYESLSVFKDTVADPEKRQWVYKITVVDTCGNESDIKDSPYHKPLFLQYVSSVDGVNLEWEKYEVEGNELDFITYEIYRGSDSISLDYLDEVSGDLRVYKDNSADALSKKFYYRIGGVKAVPCEPSEGRKAGTGPYRHSLSNLEDNKLKADTSSTDTTTWTYAPEVQELIVFPNPVTEMATIRMDNKEGDEYRMVLLDVSGKIVRMREGIREEEFVFNRGDLSPGYYHLKLVGDRIYHGKIIVK